MERQIAPRQESGVAEDAFDDEELNAEDLEIPRRRKKMKDAIKNKKVGFELSEGVPGLMVTNNKK